MPSASPLADDRRRMLEMENSGAGAIVLASLFEDPEAPSTLEPGPYAERIAAAKDQVGIPIIASLNASSLGSWVKGARLIEQAGADALELNIYNLTLSPTVSSSEVEASYTEIVRAVAETVRIPVAVKLSPYFTNLSRMALALEEGGARGLILFNRFYQSDIDLDGFEPATPMRLSTASENRLPRRWLSLLYRSLRLDLAANSGIRTGSDVLKAVLCGASATQVCSVLMERGIPLADGVGKRAAGVHGALPNFLPGCRARPAQPAGTREPWRGGARGVSQSAARLRAARRALVAG